MKKRIQKHIALLAAVATLAGVGVTWSRLPAVLAAERFAEAREARYQDREVGEVRVHDVLVMRFRESESGRSGPSLATDVARRLNDLQERKALRPSELRVRPAGDVALLLADEEVIVVVDAAQARANGVSTADLARTWRNNLLRALEPAGLVQPVSRRAEDATDERSGATARRLDRDASYRPTEESRSKIVPILTVGSSLRVGVAQVTGPISRVDDVKAVARLDTDYKDRVRIGILIPVATENVVSNIRRVPQVSVSAVGDLKL
jgi:hypothetical protein